MPVIRESVVARILAHRRDEHPIGKRQISNRERIKQARHGRKSEVHRSEISNPNATYEQSSNSSRGRGGGKVGVFPQAVIA